MQEIPAQEPMKQWTLMAVHALGGSGHNREIEEKVRQLLNLSDDVSDQIYPGSRQTILDHRTAFARSHLKRGRSFGQSPAFCVDSDRGRGRSGQRIHQSSQQFR